LVVAAVVGTAVVATAAVAVGAYVGVKIYEAATGNT